MNTEFTENWRWPNGRKENGRSIYSGRQIQTGWVGGEMEAGMGKEGRDVGTQGEDGGRKAGTRGRG